MQHCCVVGLCDAVCVDVQSLSIICARCRFDVLCVVRDIVDPVQDQRLAEFVVGSHARSHPDGVEDDREQQQPQVQPQDPDILPQDLLRKYIAFAKQQIRPSLSTVSSSGCCFCTCV